MKEDVTSSKVVREWIDDLDYSRALLLIIVEDGGIIADGTFQRRRAGTRSHLAAKRVVVERRKGRWNTAGIRFGFNNEKEWNAIFTRIKSL